METLEKISYRLSKIAAYLSAGILVYMVLHILFEITLRLFFAKSTYVLDEFVAYGTAAITFLCLAYSLHDEVLIRVGMLLNRLHGKTKKAFELFSVSITFVRRHLYHLLFLDKNLLAGSDPRNPFGKYRRSTPMDTGIICLGRAFAFRAGTFYHVAAPHPRRCALKPLIRPVDRRKLPWMQ